MTKVSYFYDSDIGNYHYATQHPMKPHRIRMTHNLVTNYNLYKHLNVIRPSPASKHDMTRFHSNEYIDFIHRINPSMSDDMARNQSRFNIGEDCPVFDGLFEFCSKSVGGSLAAAKHLNQKDADIAINWGGGLHHAKKAEASGFCYVNDIVLAILDLLRVFARVLYIDVDVHHGDGVEEAFFTSDRVMTASFHKFGEFFPGTGDTVDIGYGRGKYYSVNVPLKEGIDDESYKSIFRPVIQHIMDWYKPAAVVLQMGADSLSGDRLGCFNLSMKGHAQALEFLKTFNIPLMVLGGGGYTIRNVSRTWTYETALAVGQTLPTQLPFNDYLSYFGPDYILDVPATNMENQNSRQYLDKIKAIVIENLRNVSCAPSVQLQQAPPDPYSEDEEDDAQDELNKDVRNHTREMDKRVALDYELEESDDEPMDDFVKMDERMD